MKTDPCEILLQITDLIGKSRNGLTISDVGAELRINWRTAKKYLETLEKLDRTAGIIESIGNYPETRRIFTSRSRKAKINSPFSFRGGSSVVCKGCDAVLFRSEYSTSAKDIIRYFNGVCPNCKKPLTFNPEDFQARAYAYVKVLRGWALTM